MKKILSLVALFALMTVLFASTAFADVGDIQIDNVEVNGVDIDDLDSFLLEVEEGEDLDIEVTIRNVAERTDDGVTFYGVDLENVQVEAELFGYEFDDYVDLEDESESFDIKYGRVKVIDLTIPLPVFLDEVEASLEIVIDDINTVGSIAEATYALGIEPVANGVAIEDVVFSPGSEVKAGRSLLTTVLLQNYGENDEDLVKVTVAIPELGVSATDYVDDFETEDNREYVAYEHTEELFLQIPECAAPGQYTVEVTAEYDRYESTTERYTITVLDGSYCSGASSERVLIAVGPESQTVSAGERAVYTVVLTNEGDSSETYTLELTTGDWSTASLSESVVVLGSNGDSQVVYANVDVSSSASGAHTASLVVSNNGQVIETISLGASVNATAGTDFDFRNGLELALIILVVLLVVIGLIIGFTRLRRDEEEAYY